MIAPFVRPLAVALACFFVAGCAHRIEPLALDLPPTDVEAPVYVVVGLAIMAQVKVNDGEPLLFQVDTGAPICAISPFLAKKLWKSPDQAPADRTIHLSWGTLDLPKLPVQVRSEAGETDSKIQGIIGCNLLAAFSEVEFVPVPLASKDLSASVVPTVLKLRGRTEGGSSSSSSGGRLEAPIGWYTGHPTVSFRVGTPGKERNEYFFLDTGSDSLTASSEMDKVIPYDVLKKAFYQEGRQVFYKVPQFHIGGLDFGDVVVGIDLTAGRWPSKITHGSALLGMSVLSRGRWTIDFKHDRFTFDLDPSLEDPLLYLPELAARNKKEKTKPK